AADGVRQYKVAGVQTCALPIWGDRTANTLLTISPTAGSSCEYVTHTCTSTVASDHTVTGTDAGAATTTDTATLHVNAAALDHISSDERRVGNAAGRPQAQSP